jgi:hypothetical protein
MAGSKCFAPVRGRAMRATRLDGCGRPIYGDDNVAVSKGFVSISFTANNQETTEVLVENAAGERCIYEPARTSFTNYSLEIAFCNVDPALYALLTGQEVISDPVTGDAIGFSVNSDIDTSASAFALEIWTGSPQADACSDDQSQGSFGYLLTPYVQGGSFGDFTIENGAITFTITGAQTKVGSTWGTGPYNVQLVGGEPAPLSSPVLSGDHLRVLAVEVAPPTTYCGLRPLLDPTDPEVTSIAGTVDGLEVTLEPTPAGTDPMWYDFGDGTWDYSETGSYVHEYDEAGTYTVIGYRGNSSATTEVTVA